VRTRLQQVEDPDGFVEWSTAQPGGALSGQVRGYIGYREDTSGPVHRWETPAGEFNLIVSFGDGFRAPAVPGAGELSSYTSFVAGMHDRPSRTAHDGRQLGIQIRLDPLGAFSLFGVPLHELGNRVVELAELLGPDGERWAGQLLEARAWEDRFALLDRLLTDRIAAGPMPSPELAWSWRTMRDAGGAVRVADLADGAGCSHRYLVARFREQIGATPKTAARVLRYARAARLLARGDLALSQVAALCGYADQPHMTREFAALAGTTPGAVAANQRPRHDGAGEHSAKLIRRSVSFKTSPARRPTVPP
jgi:AraC-like DNA-binding protein